MLIKNSGTIILLILGTVFSIAGGVASFGYGKPLLDKAKASTEWPTTDGKVIESEVERHRNNDDETMYKAMVIYQYSLDGANFESDRVWYGDGYSTNDRSAMQTVVKEYPVGKKVTVYYSPDAPDEAVLQPGAFFSSYLLFGIGLTFAVIGSLMVVGVTVKRVLGASMGDSWGSHPDTFGDDTFNDDHVSFDAHGSDDERFTDSFSDH
jgi:hypothetical protein